MNSQTERGPRAARCPRNPRHLENIQVVFEEDHENSVFNIHKSATSAAPATIFLPLSRHKTQTDKEADVKKWLGLGKGKQEENHEREERDKEEREGQNRIKKIL